MITEHKDKKSKDFTDEENITIAEIVENEEDKKILEPLVKNNNKPKVGYIVSNGIFLRKEKDNGSEIVAFLKKGDSVGIDYEKSTNEFFCATAYGVVGYVNAKDVIFK